MPWGLAGSMSSEVRSEQVGGALFFGNTSMTGSGDAWERQAGDAKGSWDNSAGKWD